MPELPEVETVRTGAEPHLVGRRLHAVELMREDLRWPMPRAALEDLKGRRCVAVDRRSKYLLLRFDGPGQPVALVHLGMTGRMLVEVTSRTAARPELRKHEHTHRDYVLEAASALFDELQGLNAARCDDLRSDASTRTARAYRALQERQAALDAGEAGR